MDTIIKKHIKQVDQKTVCIAAKVEDPKTFVQNKRQ